MDWVGILAGFGLGCAGLAGLLYVQTTWWRGCLPLDERAAYRKTPAWQALIDQVAARRGYRCASGWRCAGPLHLHHWMTRNYGEEYPWQVLFLCERHHLSGWRFSAHWWSKWLLGSLDRGLWFSTGLVVGCGKLARLLGRRSRQGTTVRRAA